MRLAVFWPERFSNVSNISKLEKIVGAEDYYGAPGCHCFEIYLSKSEIRQLCRKLSYSFNLCFSISCEPDPNDEDQDWSITGI